MYTSTTYLVGVFIVASSWVCALKPTGMELVHREHSGNPFTFREYVDTFGKSYEGEEEFELRKSIFSYRLAEIVRHNSNLMNTYTKGINHMSDWTQEEYEAQMGYKPRANAQYFGSSETVTPGSVASLPKAIDWRACSAFSNSVLCPDNTLNTSVVTPVKNQLSCGSCYAFASTAVLESHLAISTGTYMDLSPQHIVSCAPNTHKCGGSGGCDGSTADTAYRWIHRNGGLASAYEYGYTSGLAGDTGACIKARTSNTYAKVGPVLGKPTSNDYKSLMAALVKGPVAVNVYASHWRDYESGIYNGCAYDEDIPGNHVVALEGYGPGYWLIRNSWGSAYGEEGYIRLQREDTEYCGTDSRPQDGWDCAPFPSNVTVCGMCGVAYEPTYPTGVTN